MMQTVVHAVQVSVQEGHRTKTGWGLQVILQKTDSGWIPPGRELLWVRQGILQIHPRTKGGGGGGGENYPRL
jgi:hypothetical protein